MNEATVSLAQDFACSNNVNLLLPFGQFGSREKNGADHGNFHYLSVGLNPITMWIFLREDFSIQKRLRHLEMLIEPDVLLPIIPTVLLNPSTGIGNGFSTKIPSFDLSDIIENLQSLIGGKEFIKMTPYFKDFKGSIIELNNGQASPKLLIKRNCVFLELCLFWRIGIRWE